MVNQQDSGRCLSSQAALPPSGLSRQEASQAKPAAANAGDIIKLAGDKYSPNLRRFLIRQKRPWRGLQNVYRDKDECLWIGWIDDINWFSGCRLARCLTVGGKAEVYAHPPGSLHLSLVPDFWGEYARIGRCAIDPKHRGWWAGEETRWDVAGDTRSCLWCESHVEHLRRWTEAVEREQWEPASCDTHPKDGDAVAAPLVSGAVPEGQTPTISQGPNP